MPCALACSYGLQKVVTSHNRKYALIGYKQISGTLAATIENGFVIDVDLLSHNSETV